MLHARIIITAILACTLSMLSKKLQTIIHAVLLSCMIYVSMYNLCMQLHNNLKYHPKIIPNIYSLVIYRYTQTLSPDQS